MPPPYVTKVSSSATTGQMTFTVLIDGLEEDVTEEEFIEVTGAATQVGGAFAMINQVVNSPTNVDDKGTGSVDVTVTPSPAKKFRPDLDVTVFLRVSRVWVTVLGQGQADRNSEHPEIIPAGEHRWGIPRASAQVYAQ